MVSASKWSVPGILGFVARSSAFCHDHLIILRATAVRESEHFVIGPFWSTLEMLMTSILITVCLVERVDMLLPRPYVLGFC